MIFKIEIFDRHFLMIMYIYLQESKIFQTFLYSYVWFLIMSANNATSIVILILFWQRIILCVCI